MNINKLMGVCYACNVPKRIGSASMTIRNMQRELENIMRKNNIQLRDLSSINPRGLKVRLYPAHFKCHLSKICGRCSDGRYRAFNNEEDVVLKNICNLLQYMLINNMDIDLTSLKRCCSGSYALLYRSIERVQLTIEREYNANNLNDESL